MTKLTDYDVTNYLDSDEMIAEYLNAATEENDPDFFLSAFDNVIRAKGMSYIAKRSGLGRESLYKAFKTGAKPQYETVLKVLLRLVYMFSLWRLNDLMIAIH